MAGVTVEATQSEHNPPKLTDIEGDGWLFQDGKVSQGQGATRFDTKGIEPLTYNNPFAQGLERVWYDGKIVYALDAGELEIASPGEIKVAQEYQVVYSVELDDRGKLKGEPEQAPGQLNIYDSVPGDDRYSPIWQFNFVVVPREYEINSLRSERDCRQSGYPILQSSVFEN